MEDWTLKGEDIACKKSREKIFLAKENYVYYYKQNFTIRDKSSYPAGRECNVLIGIFCFHGEEC